MLSPWRSNTRVGMYGLRRKGPTRPRARAAGAPGERYHTGCPKRTPVSDPLRRAPVPEPSNCRALGVEAAPRAGVAYPGTQPSLLGAPDVSRTTPPLSRGGARAVRRSDRRAAARQPAYGHLGL